jgi:hypothetical protein
MNGYRSYLLCRPVDMVDAKEKNAKKQGYQRVLTPLFIRFFFYKNLIGLYADGCKFKSGIPESRWVHIKGGFASKSL